jgi:hypothetical protein
MATHTVKSSTGSPFEIVIDDDGRIADVVGNWPEAGEEFELRAPLPAHRPPENPPAEVVAKARQRQADVCFYDPNGCRTCFCDDKGHMHCVGEC